MLTIRLLFPAPPEYSTGMNEGSRAIDSPALVLIVDDNERNRILLETIIGKGTPYEPILAENGAAALARAAERPPDLVLLDVLMPGMNGYEVATRFKEIPALKDVPIIFITALTEVDEKVRAFEVGGIDCIVKPIEPREVISRVTAQIELRRRHEEIRRLNHAMNLELDLARKIQRAIMPGETIRHARALVAGRCLPLEKVSGDYHDVIAIDDDILLVFLADITGHGVPAALYTMMLKTDLYYLVRFTRSPAEILARLNERLCRTLIEDFFITASLLVVDLSASPTIVHASAGHPPALRLAADGAVEPLASNSLFLGWRVDQEFTETRLDLRPGEAVFIHTDGFTDAIRAVRGAASAEEFIRAARRGRDFRLCAWIETTMEELRRAEAARAADDDLSIVGVEIVAGAA